MTSGLNVLKFLSKKVPYVGWAYQIFTVYEIIRKGMDLCDKLVEQVRVVTDAFKEFLSLVASPSGVSERSVRTEVGTGYRKDRGREASVGCQGHR